MGDVLKLRPAADTEQTTGHPIRGHVVEVRPDGKALFRDSRGEAFEVEIPRHIGERWLKEAVALAPVRAVALWSDDSSPAILWGVFTDAEHRVLDEHFQVEAKTIELAASESACIHAGDAIVFVSADGQVEIRGKNVLSRASNLNRIRGGGVFIN